MSLGNKDAIRDQKVKKEINFLLRSPGAPKFFKLEIYEKLWNAAVPAFERGAERIDRHLPDKTRDLRRGVTLLCRPLPIARGAVTDFMGRLAEICPRQYFYQPEELHVTVLSIITMTELWEQEMDRFKECRPLIGRALSGQRPFKIKFYGVTASPDSILIQGFPLNDGLGAIRTSLRQTFTRAGFADMLDRRYKVTAAHITIMRFSRPCPDSTRLVAFLGENRQTNFGECEIGELELIFGDWYASSDKVKTLEAYSLRA
jgi:2'-5' RNA ligase